MVTFLTLLSRCHFIVSWLVRFSVVFRQTQIFGGRP